MGAKLLQDVRQDLADVVQVCEGKKKQTNYLRTLINELVKGTEAPLPRSQATIQATLWGSVHRPQGPGQASGASVRTPRQLGMVPVEVWV